MAYVGRYFLGWLAFVRAFRLARRKKHGAGKQRLVHAWKGACCARFIVDGQHRGALPLWLKWRF